MFSINRRRVLAALAVGLVHSVRVLNAQSASDPQLDSLIRVALANNPRISIAQERAVAARARVRPAGTLPDPMAAAGLVNFPVSQARYDDMTMNALELRQTVPYPGKLSLQKRAAASEARAAELMVDVVKRELVRDVRLAYYDLAALDGAIRITNERRTLLGNIVEAAKARYVVSALDQGSVVKAQLETALAAREIAELRAQREAALATLNVLLDRSAAASVDAPPLPAAVGSLPPLAALLDAAASRNAELRAHEPMIAAQTFNVDLARKAARPDFDIALQYGQRPSRPDMISLMVGVPLPLHRNARQNEGIAEATARLRALHAEHDSLTASLRGEVARLYSEVRGLNAQIDVLSQGALSDARAVVSAAIASFQAGRIDLLGVISTQSAVFEIQSTWQRALADRASRLVELEALTGQELMP